MKITKTTLAWYRQKTKPLWAKEIIEHEKFISIDEVINSQTGYGKNIDKHYVSHNLMSLCKSYIRRGVLLEMLRELQHNPGTLIEPQKRAAYAKKWADRLEKQ